MILNLSKKKWSISIGIAIVIALAPILITIYELIKTGKESVVFLENFPSSVVLFIVIYYAILVILGILWFTKQVIAFFKLKKEISKAELLHLKSQVNPHFFFNTLNNLYGLIQKDPKKAQNLTLKLSELMRYSIYQGEKDIVNLKDEIDYLKNYIELHKMRYHKEIDVVFNTQIETDCKVMPLLFIILLENAFKHGVENLRAQAYVHMKMFTFDNKIQFDIENNFDDTEQIEHVGIGLKNLKRRLKLAYPNQHELTLSVSKNVYKATLIINQL